MSSAEVDYRDYEYPFENIVLEGGGAKGQGYIGCLQVLEEVGVKPKRVAGASAGAIAATLLAAGFTSEEMKEVLQLDLSSYMIDHSCGIFSLLPNIIRNFGWNPAKKFTKLMESLFIKKGLQPTTTFREFYQRTKVELCITAVNVNMLTVEYFHPKTTPNMNVIMAVRMSLSIPGIFQAVKLKNVWGQTDVFVDGGIVCNYPIHAFDGWWLSMKREDSFLNRIPRLSEIQKLLDKSVRFGERNNKTLGFVVHSAMEQDLMRKELDARVELDNSDRPLDSKLYQSKAAQLEKKETTEEDHKAFMKSMERFLLALKEVNRKGKELDDIVDKQELKAAFKLALEKGSKPDAHDDCFTPKDVAVLFGPNATIDSAFDQLDVDQNGHISYDELMRFTEQNGIDLHVKFLGYDRKELTNFGSFMMALQDCLLTNVKKLFTQESDLDRTVGVNTDYIETTDFKMEEEDRQFCYKRGRNATIAFLKEYVTKHNLPKKSKAPEQAAEAAANGATSTPAAGNGAAAASPDPTELTTMSAGEEEPPAVTEETTGLLSKE